MSVLFTNTAFKEIIDNWTIEEAIEDPFLEITEAKKDGSMPENQLNIESKMYSIKRILNECESFVSNSTFKCIKRNFI